MVEQGKNRRILVTSALPYANGDIHLGHMVEYVQSDIWVRAQRVQGNECHHVCADDAHGTPIMLKAESDGVQPEELIERMNEQHRNDISAFNIAFNNYYTTHSEENRVLSEEIYIALRDAGLIEAREIEQLFDPQKKIFLPDRYVKGDCPRCGAADQHGDSCEACGAAYSPTELKNPRSSLTGATPELRKSKHYFFRLSTQAEWLAQWLKDDIPDPMDPGKRIPRLQSEAHNKMREWLDSGLRDWDISRDGPYFGFRIPEADGEKYFYVWLDAPIGYFASFRNYCDRTGVDFDSFCKSEDTELYHFIGKDILYFHSLFWPAMLRNSGYRTPTRLFAHGFLTVNGEKMSKSRGTFITARRYAEHNLDPDWLRYYYACKLNERIEDIDLSMEDFALRVNSDLVGKYANIASRVAGFLSKRFSGELADPEEPWIKPDGDKIARLYEDRRYSEAMREIMRLAEQVNRRVEQEKPWDLAKDGEAADKLHRVCSGAIRAFRQLTVLLKPVTPRIAAEVEKFLGGQELTWSDLHSEMPAGHKIGKFGHLVKRLDQERLDKLIETGKEGDNVESAEDSSITIEDFQKVKLRIARVLAAESVAESKKLVKLTLDLGELGQRTVFAGIKANYGPEALVGKQVVVVANLKPRKMRFGTSEGMVIGADDGDGGVHLLMPDQESPDGAKIS